MDNNFKSDGLAERIGQLRHEIGDQVAVDDIADVVASLMRTVEGDLSAADLQVYRELNEIIDYIRKARSDIAALQPEDITEKHLHRATDELDAVVKATEDATDAFLDAAEQLENIAADQPHEMAQKLNTIATGIYEASSFQDITGQRISKVVATLHHIEERLSSLTAVVDGDVTDKAATGSPDPGAGESEEGLLDGPALPEGANRQEDIDALLASFD